MMQGWEAVCTPTAPHKVLQLETAQVTDTNTTGDRRVASLERAHMRGVKFWLSQLHWQQPAATAQDSAH